MYAREQTTNIQTPHCTHKKGFSLLELSFVILLVSVIAVSTGIYIKNANEKSAAKKVAGQMVYWLNSATTYYSAQGKWPDSLATLANTMGVQLPSQQPYTLQSSNESAQGSSISIVLPSLSFARLVQAQLARAIIDDSNPNKITLYAYTPPLATALSPNAQVKGVGNLTFYNCRYNGDLTGNHHFECSEVGVSGSIQPPCVDPMNNHSYDTQDAIAYHSSSGILFNHYSGLCALPVPQCSAGSIPQIYYAISQFRAPSYTENTGHSSKNKPAYHLYQLYPYQVNAACQTIDSQGHNFGPCGPNLADETVYDSIKSLLYPDPNGPQNPLYFSLGFSLRNYQFNLGVTSGVESYNPSARPEGPPNNDGGNITDWAGNFYDEHQYYWSAVVSYVMACVPRENINNFVDGGTVYYLSGNETMANASNNNKIKTDQGVTAYSQSMLTN